MTSSQSPSTCYALWKQGVNDTWALPVCILLLLIECINHTILRKKLYNDNICKKKINEMNF